MIDKVQAGVEKWGPINGGVLAKKLGAEGIEQISSCFTMLMRRGAIVRVSRGEGDVRALLRALDALGERLQVVPTLADVLSGLVAQLAPQAVSVATRAIAASRARRPRIPRARPAVDASSDTEDDGASSEGEDDEDDDGLAEADAAEKQARGGRAAGGSR
jgi:hypothetical protein